jgi:hypothetical protein
VPIHHNDLGRHIPGSFFIRQGLRKVQFLIGYQVVTGVSRYFQEVYPETCNGQENREHTVRAPYPQPLPSMLGAGENLQNSGVSPFSLLNLGKRRAGDE